MTIGDYRRASEVPSPKPLSFTPYMRKQNDNSIELDINELNQPIDQNPNLEKLVPDYYRNFPLYQKPGNVLIDVCHQTNYTSYDLKGVELSEVGITKFINPDDTLDDTLLIINIEYTSIWNGYRSNGSSQVIFDGSTFYDISGKPIKLTSGVEIGPQIFNAFLKLKGLDLKI